MSVNYLAPVTDQKKPAVWAATSWLCQIFPVSSCFFILLYFFIPNGHHGHQLSKFMTVMDPVSSIDEENHHMSPHGFVHRKVTVR